MAVDDTGPDPTDGFENHRFQSGDLSLVAHLARPPLSGDGRPGVVICHGFPSGPGGGANSVSTFPELAFRIATERRWFLESWSAAALYWESRGENDKALTYAER